MREIDFLWSVPAAKRRHRHAVHENMSRPNGIGFSPDHNTLYVANGDGHAILSAAHSQSTENALGAPRAFLISRTDACPMAAAMA